MSGPRGRHGTGDRGDRHTNFSQRRSLGGFSPRTRSEKSRNKKDSNQDLFHWLPPKIPSYATDSRQGCSESTRCPSMRRPKPAVLIQDERDAGKGGQNVAFVIIAVVSGT